jgi:hypothetical protein
MLMEGLAGTLANTQLQGKNLRKHNSKDKDNNKQKHNKHKETIIIIINNSKKNKQHN